MVGVVCIGLERGERPIEIARRLNVRVNSVHKIRQRFEQRSGMKITRYQQRGRPRKAS